MSANVAAQTIQCVYRGYLNRKKLTFHMVCGNCDCPEYMIGLAQWNSMRNEPRLAWNHYCRNCHCYFDERELVFKLCESKAGIGWCEECECLKRQLEAFILVTQLRTFA